MRVVFMGTPDYARVVLDALVKDGMEVLAVFTQPDKPVGRKQILTPSEVKTYAINNLKDAKIYEPKTLKDKNLIDEIKSLKPEFIVVAAYGKILPKAVLDIAPCINLHASILPKYRGASPIQSAIKHGEKVLGVTTMLMDDGLDTGDMLEFAYTDSGEKMAYELFDELAVIAGNLAVSTLRNFKNITPQKQNESLASHCKKIEKTDGLINLNENSEQIYNKFRAFNPWPGIFLESGLKILSLKPSNLNGKVGVILEIKKDSFILGVGDGSIEIFSVQEPSKKAIGANEYINGKRLKLGDRIS